MRCLALGDELVSRGVTVTLLGAVTGIPWVEQQARERGLEPMAVPADPEALAGVVTCLGADAAVLDGYSLDPRTGAALRSAGVAVLAVADGPFGANQAADVYLDQNLGAGPISGAQVSADAVQLLDLPHVLFRDEVLRHRRSLVPPPARPPRVLTVFGGTDPYAAGPVVVPLLLSTGSPLEVVAVAANSHRAEAIRSVQPGRGQAVQVASATPDLAELAATCDLAVTAAGSSAWELLCLGVPIAVVCVVDNQAVGYDAAVEHDVAVGLGHLEALRSDPGARATAVASLAQLLARPARRAELVVRGQHLVDGLGRVRVADALLTAASRRR